MTDGIQLLPFPSIIYNDIPLFWFIYCFSLVLVLVPLCSAWPYLDASRVLQE
jgi:alanine-alpha-ketoisovalerate/valine-pyruvate aminotransferase